MPGKMFAPSCVFSTAKLRLQSTDATAAALELKTSRRVHIFIHREVAQSWLRNTSMDLTGRLSWYNSLLDSVTRTEPAQCWQKPLRATCSGVPRSSSGARVKLSPKLLQDCCWLTKRPSDKARDSEDSENQEIPISFHSS